MGGDLNSPHTRGRILLSPRREGAGGGTIGPLLPPFVGVDQRESLELDSTLGPSH
jgi:hypothetical protein